VGWDASRPVPWRRLVKEWLIYAGIMTVVLLVAFRDGGRLIPILGGLLISGPLYLGLGWALAKLGYVRKTLADMRTPRADARSASGSTAEASRAKPPPTRRTSTGANRPRAKRR
jgi:hypothetical protein